MIVDAEVQIQICPETQFPGGKVRRGQNLSNTSYKRQLHQGHSWFSSGVFSPIWWPHGLWSSRKIRWCSCTTTTAMTSLLLTPIENNKSPNLPISHDKTGAEAEPNSIINLNPSKSRLLMSLWSILRHVFTWVVTQMEEVLGIHQLLVNTCWTTLDNHATKTSNNLALVSFRSNVKLKQQGNYCVNPECISQSLSLNDILFKGR